MHWLVADLVHESRAKTCSTTLIEMVSKHRLRLHLLLLRLRPLLLHLRQRQLFKPKRQRLLHDLQRCQVSASK